MDESRSHVYQTQAITVASSVPVPTVQSSVPVPTVQSTVPVPAVQSSVHVPTVQSPVPVPTVQSSVPVPALQSFVPVQGTSSVNLSGPPLATAASGNTVPPQFFNAIVGCSKASDDLSRNVSNNVKQKIIAGEYIDLSLLLSNSQISCEDRHKIVVSQGELVIQQKQQQQKIVDISSWTDAFLIYTSIYCSVHQTKFQDLLKYMHSIRLGARRSSQGWKLYDEQFRLRKSQDPASSWAVIDQELWLLFMYSAQSVNNINPVVGGYKCYAFNYRGNCTRPFCTYSHACLRCFGSHPLIVCPRQNILPNRSGGVLNEKFAHPQLRPRSQSRFPHQVVPNVQQFNSRQPQNMYRPRVQSGF